MLRGVNWLAVARYVNLSEELQLPLSRSAGGAPTAGSGGIASTASGLLPRGEPPGGWAIHAGGTSAAQALAAEGDTLRGQRQAALREEGELFESAGWAAPSLGRGRSQRAKALSDLG